LVVWFCTKALGYCNKMHLNGMCVNGYVNCAKLLDSISID
jgi:hypothetical protein